MFRDMQRSPRSQGHLEMNVDILSFSRVTVHSRKNVPLVDDEGLMVEPNTAADIAIERVSISLYVLFAACIWVLQGLIPLSKGNDKKRTGSIWHMHL